MNIRISEKLKEVDKNTFLKYIEALGGYSKKEKVIPSGDCKVILYIKSFHNRPDMAVALHNQCENVFQIDLTIMNASE